MLTVAHISLRCFGDFVLGLLTYRLAASRKVTAWAGCNTLGIGLLLAITVALVTGLPDLVVVALFPPLLLNLSANRGFSAWLFGNAVMVRLGVLSYAIYLLHPLLERPAQNLAGWCGGIMPDVPALAVTSVVTIGVLLTVASGAYRWVEQPGRQLLRRVEVAWIGRDRRIATQ
jgi:peptidoglycan/LPS O-acetylase OafA/YrhL